MPVTKSVISKPNKSNLTISVRYYVILLVGSTRKACSAVHVIGLSSP
jgi:hypothetical protein